MGDVSFLSCVRECFVHAAGETLTQAENKFTQIAEKAVKFLVFDTCSANVFLVAAASVVNTEKLCTSIHMCTHVG